MLTRKLPRSPTGIGRRSGRSMQYLQWWPTPTYTQWPQYSHGRIAACAAIGVVVAVSGFGGVSRRELLAPAGTPGLGVVASKNGARCAAFTLSGETAGRGAALVGDAAPSLPRAGEWLIGRRCAATCARAEPADLGRAPEVGAVCGRDSNRCEIAADMCVTRALRSIRRGHF